MHDPLTIRIRRSARKRIRARLRRVVLSGLAWYGRAVGSTASGLRKPRVHFLYLHSVHASQEAHFRSLLTRLQEGHRFVSYSSAVRLIRNGKIDGAYVTFSFDDGYLSCRRAARVLEEFGATAAFFVCPALVDCRNQDEVSRILGVGNDYKIEPTMDWDDLMALREKGHEIGSHTMSHANLATAEPDRLGEEIGCSYEVLKGELGTVAHFAWPYGRFSYFSAEAATVVFESGFETCASAERGCHSEPATDGRRQLCLRRENVELNHTLNQLLFFMGRSSLNASASDNLWPNDWMQNNR